MGLVNRLTRASTLATVAFRSGWSGMDKLTPLTNVTYARRMEQYFIMQAAYDGDIFIDNLRWKPYLRERDLHDRTTCIINPMQRLADFYAATIYPGYLSSTGYPVASNVPLAIPLLTNNDALRRAIGQIWQWSNWEENLTDWIRMGATLGDAPCEIVDDYINGKVYPVVVRPEFITDVTFDDRKNVTSYTKTLRVWDEERKEHYEYERTIDKDFIYTFKNGKPFGYDGEEAISPNIYGFVPLVWVKHRDPGKGILPGKPAIRDWRKIEELNSDFSRLRAYIKKQTLTPMLLAAMGDITPPVSEVDGEEINIEDMMILTAAAAGQLHKLEGNLDISAAFDQIKVQMEEIDNDHPELKAEEKMKGMSQVTGPASEDLLGPTKRNVTSVAKGYDRATISMFQQLVAIGGYRANEGADGWEKSTPQQQKFLSFNLDSYANGDLDFGIAPRHVLSQNDFDLARTRTEKYVSYAAGERADITLDLILEDEGMPSDQIERYMAAREAKRKKDLEHLEELLKLQQKYPTIKIGGLNTASAPANASVQTKVNTPDTANQGRSLASKSVNGSKK